MTQVEDFGKTLFTILARELILAENSGSSSKNLDYSDSKDDISRSVLMLSYSYRPAFKECFEKLSTLLSAKGNPMTFVCCFAKASNQKYWPFKFLIVCSFISEIFLFLGKSKSISRQSYIEQTTKALNDSFKRIFEKNFPKNGWTDIQNIASKTARGFQFLKPFMHNETSMPTASQVADSIITDNSKSENETQQGIVMAEPTQSAQNSVRSFLIKIPCNLSPHGMPTNQTAYIQYLVYETVFPISLGKIDQVPQLLHLLHSSGSSNDAVTFQNPSDETVPNFKEIEEIVDKPKIESDAQDNLTAKSFKDESVTSVRTMQLTNSGMSEPFAEDNPIASEEKLIGDGKQLCQNYPHFFTEPIGNTSESYLPSFTENDSNFSRVILSKENDPENEKFLTEKTVNDPEDKIIPKEETVSDPESKTFSKEENILTSENAVKVPENHSKTSFQGWSNAALQDIITTETVSSQKSNLEQANEIEINFQTDKNNLSAKILHLTLGEKKFVLRMPTDIPLVFEYNGRTSSANQTETNESETNPKEEIVSDPKGEAFSKEEIVVDPDSEEFSKEENILSRENAVNVPENQSKTSCKRPSNAELQDFITKKTEPCFSSQKNGVEQANEIEINFQTDESNRFTKEWYLTVGENKFVVRMPADTPLVFEYNGQTSNASQSEKMESETTKEIISDPEGETFSKEEIVGDTEGKLYTKEEIVSDPEGEIVSKEKTIDNSDSETFSKENTLSRGNSVNVPENQS